jgi:hypothetical protein
VRLVAQQAESTLQWSGVLAAQRLTLAQLRHQERTLLAVQVMDINEKLHQPRKGMQRLVTRRRLCRR